jgi:hypothetical protein
VDSKTFWTDKSAEKWLEWLSLGQGET